MPFPPLALVPARIPQFRALADAARHHGLVVEANEQVRLLDAIEQINGLERVFCGRLLRRMVRVGWRFDRLLPKYGVDGTPMLLRAQVMRCWIYILGVPMILFAATGTGVVAVPLFGVIAAIGIVGLAYTSTAARIRKQRQAKS